MPKVSIIIPVYNVAHYLRECLDSVINQTLKDIEIICVNDGSTDNSAKILEEYALKDNRIIIINKENTGYGHSMNIGIEKASSEYIGILEADDFAEPDMYCDLYNLISEYDCECAKSNYYFYYTKNNKSVFNNMIKEKRAFNVTNAKEYPQILYFIPTVWSAIYKKDFLQKHNIKFLETPGAGFQDVSFQCKVLMCAEKVILTNKGYVHYRQDNANSSINCKDKIYFITNEFSEIHNYISERPELEQFRQYVYEIQFSGYKWNFNRIGKKHRDEFFEFFHNEFINYFNNKLLPDTFIQRINKYENFNQFINSPQKYKKSLIRAIKKEKWTNFRRNIIRIRLRKNSLLIKLLGKTIIERNENKCLK